MATKDEFLSLTHISQSSVNDKLDSQYSNLNLNQNYKCLALSIIPSHSKSTNSEKVFVSTGFENCKENKSLQSWNETTINEYSKTFNPNAFNSYNEANEIKNQKKKAGRVLSADSSTLSLHIAAYENSVEGDTISIDKNEDLKMKREEKLGLNREKTKQFFSTSVIQNLFEFPRIKEGNQKNEPELMQFKASQTLFNPNKSASTKNDQKGNEREMNEMGVKKEIRRCQYSRKKCYYNANPSSSFCTLHEENLVVCRYICPSTHVQCSSPSLDNIGYCDTHKRFLDRNRQRYNAFEQKYCSRLPAYKREDEVDFVEGQLNHYVDYARYVDVLSRPIPPHPISNAGIYSTPEIENLKNAASESLQSRLKETRNLYQQRAHSVAFALDEEIKERSKNEEKFTIVTNSSAETAIALQALLDEHEKKIEELPAADKNELSHPAQRQKIQEDANSDIKSFDNICHYSKIRRNVPAPFILNNHENQKKEPVEEAVQQIMSYILEILDTNPEPIAYTSERVCSNQRMKGFNHCFKHLWKEAPALKKCIECDSTCTLASNLCGECLKPFIDIKTENMVCFSDDDEEMATVSVGPTDNDFNEILTECAKKLKAITEVEKDSDLEITSPHKFDSKNLAEEKRLEFMWGDMLKFGLECENITFAKEIKTKNGVLPASTEDMPFKYNKLYDIDKIIATPSADETSQPEAETVTFCPEGVKKPMVCRFPSRTLSEKVAKQMDKISDIALGIEDPSQLPIQFRPVSAAPLQASINTVPQQTQINRLPRATFYPTSSANTIRLIRDVNPAARSNHQFLYAPGSRHGTQNVFVQNPRPSTFIRPLRLIRPQQTVKYVYQNVSYVATNPSASYIPSSVPLSYTSANPATYSQSLEGSPVTYLYYQRAHAPQYPPTYRRFPNQ